MNHVPFDYYLTMNGLNRVSGVNVDTDLMRKVYKKKGYNLDLFDMCAAGCDTTSIAFQEGKEYAYNN